MPAFHAIRPVPRSQSPHRRRIPLNQALVALFLLLPFMSACMRSQPARFYLLTLPPAPAAEQIATPAFMLGVGPVSMPEYLNRPQIVSRESGSGLRLSEMHRWAEPLRDNFQRQLAEGLGARLAGCDPIQFPWRPAQRVDAQVAVAVLAFEGAPGTEVTLSVRATLFGPDGVEKDSRRFNFTEQAGADYPAYVDALSRALARLCDELARFAAPHRLTQP